MKRPWEWTEHDINALIQEQRREDLGLEYKRSDALDKTDGKKKEISKDVSAMANSAGGVIVYGIDEQKSSSGPIILDAGIDPKKFSRDWLEQVIASGIQRRIDGVRVNKIAMHSTGNVVYTVYVPQSSLAPHMAADHRYHKRLGTVTARMEEYEVRDVARRLEAPDLYLEFDPVRPLEHGSIMISPHIVNRAVEPAFYASLRVFFPREIRPHRMDGGWVYHDGTELVWNGEVELFDTFRLLWVVPERRPLLEGERLDAGSLIAKIPSDSSGRLIGRVYRLGWELRAPKMASRFSCLELIAERGEPRLEELAYILRRP